MRDQPANVGVMAARVKQEAEEGDGGWPADFQTLRHRPFDQARHAPHFNAHPTVYDSAT